MKLRTISIIAILLSAFLIICSMVINPEDKDEDEKYLPLEEAIKHKLVDVQVQGLGGHTGECVEMTITNRSQHDTAIYVESGRRLYSYDTTKQDILVVKKKRFLLAAMQKIKLKLFGFCCQAHKGGPSDNDEFSAGKMADTNLVKLANYLNDNEYPENAMQSAVWCISDDNPIESIHDEDKEKIRKLHKFVASLKGLKITYPWYTLTFKTDTASLYTGIPNNLYAEYEYEVWNNCKVSLLMHDENGNVLKRFFTDINHNPNEYVYKFEMDVREMKRGNYFVRLFANGQMKYERLIKL